MSRTKEWLLSPETAESLEIDLEYAIWNAECALKELRRTRERVATVRGLSDYEIAYRERWGDPEETA